MSNRYARILAAGGTAVLAVTVGVPAALAAGTWTIQPGGAVQVTSSSRVTVKDTTTGTVITCPSSATSGTLKSGSGLPGPHAGSLSAVSFTTCIGPGAPAVAIKLPLQAAGLPWHVNLSSFDATKGVARGAIGHIRIRGTGSGCAFVIDGTSATGSGGRVAFRYTDNTGGLTVLTTGGNLHFYDVSADCLGLFESGNPAILAVTYTLTPKQSITSP